LNSHCDGPLYRVPFLSLFGWPIGAVALGIAQHAIDLMSEMAATKTPAGGGGQRLKDRPVFHQQLAEATAKVASARALLHQTLQDIWARAENGERTRTPLRIMGSLAACNATQSARQAVDLMFLAGGGTAVYRNSELQRCLRDVHAISQHAGTSPATFMSAGAMLAGAPPSNPLFPL
jgi:alkylation response protein AidB-like acyl-CoA dehydrogenase